MKYVFLCAFALLSLMHLMYSWKDEKKGRAMTKPFLLILLLLYYAFSAKPVDIWLAAALFTSWLGDVLLIPEGNGWFTAGGIAFLLSHLCFIGAYVKRIDFAAVRWLWVLPAAIVYFGIAWWIIRTIRETTPKSMVVPMHLYLLANGAMNTFAFMLLISVTCTGSAFAFVGAILFFASDCTLFLLRYGPKPELIFKKHFTVMLTYLLGEFLIAQGILMLGF